MHMLKEIRELALIDLVIECRRMLRDTLAANPSVDPDVIHRDCLAELRRAVADAEAEGELEPADAERVLELGSIGLAAERAEATR